MSTRIGVGKSNETDAYAAGQAAAKMALEHTGVDDCDFVMLFATVGYDQEQLLNGVKSVTGNAPMSGCSGEGVITQDGPEGEVMFALSGSEQEHEVVGVMTFASDEIRFRNYCVHELKEDSFRAGAALGDAVKEDGIDDARILCMFPDGYATNTYRLFEGIDSVIEKPLTFIGGFPGHNLTFSRITYQYHNYQVFTEAVPCVVLRGSFDFEIGVNHGCLPIGLEKKVTKAESNTVISIENRPAWSFFQEYLGEDVKQLNSENSPAVSLGVRCQDDSTGEYDKYIVRAPFLQNPDGSILFAAEMTEGTDVRVMRRDEDKISLGATELAKKIKVKLNGRKPLAVLHFDCAGRGKMFFGNEVKVRVIDVLQDAIGKDVPWLGFFSFGEIAPVNGINHFHNQTVALCIIY